MRTLILARHSKSSWKYPELDDHDRPLNKRGKRDAPMMAERLAARELGIETIYSSSAHRAFRFAQALHNGCGGKLVEDRDLYTFSARTLLNWLVGVDDAQQCIVLVAHNPGITDLANHLTNVAFSNIPTSGLVTISVSSPWVDLSPQMCELVDFDYPKKEA